MFTQKNLYVNIFNNPINNFQILETIQMYFSSCINKPWHVYTLLLRNEIWHAKIWVTLKNISHVKETSLEKVTFHLYDILERAKLQTTNQWLPGLGSWYHYKGLVWEFFGLLELSHVLIVRVVTWLSTCITHHGTVYKFSLKLHDSLKK